MQNSELTELFNHHLVKMTESGLLQKLRRKWIDPDWQEIGIAEADSLGYEHLFLLFCIVGVGAAGALIVLAAELCQRPDPRAIFCQSNVPNRRRSI